MTTTLKQASTTSVRLGSYSTLKDLWKSYGVEQNIGVNVINGAVAGTATVVGTPPFDVGKTRPQSAKGEGINEAVWGVWRDLGLKGYWSGSSMRFGRNVFSGAILFTSYEWIAGGIRPLVGVGGGGSEE